MMIEYRVKFVRGSYGTRSWRHFHKHASSPQEAVKMARAELGKGRWKLVDVLDWDNYIPSWQR
jgi:hypothetical protein